MISHEEYLIGNLLEAYSLASLYERYAGWVRSGLPYMSESYSVDHLRALTAALSARERELMDHQRWIARARVEYHAEILGRLA